MPYADPPRLILQLAEPASASPLIEVPVPVPVVVLGTLPLTTPAGVACARAASSRGVRGRGRTGCLVLTVDGSAPKGVLHSGLSDTGSR